MIAGVPFYTRLWFERPKTDEEFAADEGTEAENYPNKVKSSAYGMDDAAELISSMGAQTEWDDKTKQNYAQWEGDGGVYKIWLEDTQSLEEKLQSY